MFAMNETITINPEFNKYNNYCIIAQRKNQGVQYVFKFDNGYGASVVRGPYTYGGDRGLWELAVLSDFSDNNQDYKLNYDTEITDDVLGYCTIDEINQALKDIKNLKIKNKSNKEE